VKSLLELFDFVFGCGHWQKSGVFAIKKKNKSPISCWFAPFDRAERVDSHSI
jgi:hypothetical protein